MLHRLSFLILFISPTLLSTGQNELGGIGQWREHYNNRSIIQLGMANSVSGEKRSLVQPHNKFLQLLLKILLPS